MSALSSETYVDIACPAWSGDVPDAAELVHDACANVLENLDLLTSAELSVKLSSDSEVRRLNAMFRGKDTPTNVLSFPHEESRNVGTPEARYLGDIILAYETCAREALEQRKALRDHLAHLTIHGVLHLLGYDHEQEEQANAMEALEIELLARMNISNPYEIKES